MLSPTLDELNGPAELERLFKFPPFVRAAGRLLQARRVAAGLTLADLAAKIGSNHASVSRIENGRYKSAGQLLQQCVEKVGLSYDDFVCDAFRSMSLADQHAYEKFTPPPITRGPRQPAHATQATPEGAREFIASARALASSLEAAGTQVTLSQFVDLLEQSVMGRALDAVLAAISTLTRKS